MFNHVTLDLPSLNRKTVDGVRYYEVENGDELLNLVSITSVTSHKNRKKFADWRERIGAAEADKITRLATSRGTDMHTLTEHYLKNLEFPGGILPLSQVLFNIAKPHLNKINNIHALEASMYSKTLGIAGTVDCIAEYNGELSIIDFKTSKKPKPREWIDHYFVQCCAYACMLYELTGITVKQFVIIMACEDGECEVYIENDKKKYIKELITYIQEFLEFKLHEYETRTK